MPICPQCKSFVPPGIETCPNDGALLRSPQITLPVRPTPQKPPASTVHQNPPASTQATPPKPPALTQAAPQNPPASLETQLPKTERREEPRSSQTRPVISGPSLSTSLSTDNVSNEWKVGDILLDLYEVRGVLGEGGMGKVYRVYHRGWDLDLAVKTPKLQITADDAVLASFVQEAETWVNLGLHPHVASCYYVRAINGVPRVFAEYVTGGSLKDWIEDGRMYHGEPSEVIACLLDIAIQFAWGLSYAHKQGIVHQDVKPANVLMTSSGIAKVTDFGLAKALRLTADSSAPDPLVSYAGMTTAYRSPEQASRRPLSIKTDIWSFGLSLLEMFTGGVLWIAGEVAREALEGYLSEEATSTPRMPAGLAELLRNCFSIVPEHRPNDMEEVAATLCALYQASTGRSYPRQAPGTIELRADALNNRALSLLDLGRSQEADALLARSMADPKHIYATYNRGLVLWRGGKLTDEELLRQVSSLEERAPESWEVSYLQALVHQERADEEGARKALEEAHRRTRDREAQGLLSRALSEPGPYVRCLSLLAGHQGAVKHLAVTPKGDLAISSQDNMLGGWELPSGRRCFSLPEPSPPALPPAAGSEARAVFTPNGLLLFASSSGLWVWDISSGPEVLCQLAINSALNVPSLSLTLDGRCALFEVKGHALHTWDLSAGVLLRSLRGNNREVTRTRITPDGRYALSISATEPIVRVWDLGSGECLHALQGEQREMSSIAISNDGRLALSGSQQGELLVWDLMTGERLSSLKGHSRDISSVALSDDKRFAISGSWDSTLRVWELSTGRCLRVIEDNGFSDALAISSDGQIAYSPGRCAWKVRTGERIEWASACMEPAILASTMPCGPTSPDGFLSAVCTPDSVKIMERATGRCLRVIGRDTGESSLEVTPDGRFLISCRGGTRRVWELPQGRRLSLAEEMAVGPVEAHIKSRFSFLIKAKPQLQDRSTQRCLRTFERYHGAVSTALTHDNHLALVGRADGVIDLLELPDFSKRSPFLLARPTRSEEVFTAEQRFEQILAEARGMIEAGQLSAALSRIEDARQEPEYQRNPRALALKLEAGSRMRRVALRGYPPLHTLNAPGHEARVLAFIPNRKLILSGGGDGALCIWDLISGRCLHRGASSESPIVSLYTSQNSTIVISQHSSGALRGWDATTGKSLYSLDGEQAVYDSVVLAGPLLLASLSRSSGGISVWELASGAPRITLKDAGSSARVECLAATPDGRLAVSGHDDGMVRAWDLSRERLLASYKWRRKIEHVAVGLDGQKVCCGDDEGIFFEWDPREGSSKAPPLIRGRRVEVANITSLFVTPDSSLAILLRAPRRNTQSAALGLWAPARMRKSATNRAEGFIYKFAQQKQFEVPMSRLLSVQLSNQTALLRTVGGLEVRDLQTGEVRWGLELTPALHNDLLLTPDESFAIATNREGHVLVWSLDWEYEVRADDWDEGARPLLEAFLIHHTPWRVEGVLPWSKRLIRQGHPTWSEADLQLLLAQLRDANFGWLRPEGIQTKLKEMVKDKAASKKSWLAGLLGKEDPKSKDT